MTSSAAPIPPWYKQFWPWFLLILPILTVIGGISVFYIAAHHVDGIVVDDYYKSGLAINQTLARDKLAAKLGLHAEGRIDTAHKRVILTLSGHHKASKLHLTLTHPTTSQQDMHIVLLAGENKNQYTGQLPELPQEKRYILLEPVDKSWRLTGSALFPHVEQWSLKPGL